MRILLRDLTPNIAYALQLRTVAGDQTSDWSRIFPITTSTDSVAPKKPTNVVGSMSGTSFFLKWDAVTQSIDNTPATDLQYYQVSVQSSGSGLTGTFNVTDTQFEFTFPMNVATFGGSPQANVQMAVRAVDKSGNTDGYTSYVSQTNPPPANVTGLVATGVPNALSATWSPNTTDLDFQKYVAYVGTTAGFTPGPGNKVWEGNATSFEYSNVAYGTDQWIKVVAMDVFNTPSATPASAGPVRPLNPTGVDSTAPAVPTGLAATLTNATDGKTAQAVVSWTAVTDTDGDLASYILGYKPSATGDWQYTTIDYTLTSTTLLGLLPYVNYDFRIRASDFSANLSAWSSTLTKTATANAAPATPTGLAITAGKDNILVRWTANTEPDMANGAGVYDVTIATDSGFTTGVLQYRTGADNIAVNGLSTNQIYYARVRATDSGGISSGYATSVNATTSNFPATPLSDGSVPSGAPTVTATAGIGYIYLNWTPVANADPVIYDVYMSTTTGFTTYDATTKITEVNGTSALIDTVVGGASLAYGTTYYFKVRARDRDGSSATISAQASAAPSKAATADISTIDASLITSGTSFTTNLFIGVGGAIQSTGYNPGVTGFKLSNTGLVVEGAGNTISASAMKAGTITATTINIGATGVLNIDSTGVVKSNNYAAGTTGYQLSNTGLEINDGSIDAKVMKTNTAFITDLIMGRSADALGTIRSFDYNSGVAGWKIGKGLFEVNGGTIKAAALQLQDSDNIVLPPYADFEFTSTFYSTSMLSPANVTKTIVNTGARFSSQFMQARATTAAAFDLYLGSSTTDYNTSVEPSTTYIMSAWLKTGATASTATLKVKLSNGTILTAATQALGASGAWQRVSGTFAVPAGITTLVPIVGSTTATIGAGVDIDGIQIERQMAGLTTPSPWTPPGTTFADGGMIRTGEIRSTTNVTVNGVSQPAWSINMSGGAQFGNANVRGSIVVGPAGADTDAGQSFIASGNYVQDTTGWKMSSSGDLEAASGKIRGNAIVDGTLTGNKIVAKTLTSDLIALGILKTNIINDASFEEQYAFGLNNSTSNVLGNLEQWRYIPLSTSGTVTRVAASGRSGNLAVGIYSPAGETNGVMSNVFPVTAGITYKLTFYGAATGAGTPITDLNIWGGATQSTVSSSVNIAPVISDSGAGWVVPPLSVANPIVVPDDYVKYEAEFTPLAGTSWACVRFRNIAPSANSTYLIDDVSVVQMGIGGGSELTAAGLRLFGDDGVESGAFVSNRPNYFTVANNGAIVASIDNAGGITGTSITSGSEIYTPDGPIVGNFSAITANNPFLDDPNRNYETNPRAVMEEVSGNNVNALAVNGSGFSSTGLVSTGAGNAYQLLYQFNADIQPYRLYEVKIFPFLATVTSGTLAAVIVRFTSNGTDPSASSAIFCRTYLTGSGQFVSLQTSRLLYSTSAATTDYRFLVQLMNVSTSGTVTFFAGDTITAAVTDLGALVQSDYQFINQVVQPATTPPAQPVTKKTYVKTYYSDSTQSRRGVSGFGNYTINSAAPTGYTLAGYYSSSNGNQFTLIQFPKAAIDTALTGATVKKVEVYVRNATFFFTSGGSQRLAALSNTTLPSAGAAFAPPASTGYTGAIAFSTGQGKWVALHSSANATVQAGGRVVMLGPGGLTANPQSGNSLSNSNFYYSKWFNHTNAAYRPQIRITYEK